MNGQEIDRGADTVLDGGLHLGPGDLAPDEERLLAALERDSAALRVDPVEEFVASVRSGRSLTQPELAVAAPDDGLTPRFTAPDPV